MSNEVIRHEPLANWVLIKRIDTDLDEVNGIVVPEIAKVQSSKGKVIAVGEGRIIGDKLVPIPLVPGDIVLFSKYGVEEIKLDGEDYQLIRYDEIKLKERRVALVQ
jgi:chaperonin GroES